MIGKLIYGYNSENRDREGRDDLPPNWRGYTVVGETKVSWLVTQNVNWGYPPTIRVNKENFASKGCVKFVATLEDIKSMNLLILQRNHINQCVNHCSNYRKLKEIQEILDRQ